MEEDGGGGADGAVAGGEATKEDMLNAGDTGEGGLLEGAIFDAVDG